MKRISFLVLFFYCCSFVNPPQSRAVAPLAVLAPAAIGAAVVAIAGTQYALRGDHSASSYQSDGRNLTVPLVAYKKLAVQGGEILLGKSVTAVLDAKKAFDDNVLQGYSALKKIIDDYFGDPSGALPVPGESVVGPENTCGLSDNRVVTSLSQTLTKVAPLCGTTSCSPDVGGTCTTGPPNYYFVQVISSEWSTKWSNWYYTINSYNTVPTTDEENYPPPGTPDILLPSDVPAISDRFAQAAPINPDVKNDLDNFLKDHPEYWPFSGTSTPIPNPESIEDYPPAQPISSADVNQWAQGQSAGAQQAYIDTLQDLVDANPTDAGLAAELAQAQAQQAQQEAEDVKDSFDSIHANPFESPYSPGQFDIPTRFSSFLDNVQGSGLFSFSSGFFNSLPGGGSSVYTIEAGQYGTHTIDLSETLGTGLAVLKTVLLLLFGFLSIRVVILKR